MKASLMCACLSWSLPVAVVCPQCSVGCCIPYPEPHSHLLNTPDPVHTPAVQHYTHTHTHWQNSNITHTCMHAQTVQHYTQTHQQNSHSHTKMAIPGSMHGSWWHRVHGLSVSGSQCAGVHDTPPPAGSPPRTESPSAWPWCKSSGQMDRRRE